MRSPFPGMDPWLEDPILWPGLHASLIVYIRDQLRPDLGERYVAAIASGDGSESAACPAPSVPPQ